MPNDQSFEAHNRMNKTGFGENFTSYDRANSPHVRDINNIPIFPDINQAQDNHTPLTT